MDSNVRVLAALEALQQNDERMEVAIANLAELLRETRETSIQKFAEIKAETKSAAKLESRICAVEESLRGEIEIVKNKLEQVKRSAESAENWILSRQEARRDDIKTIRQYAIITIFGALMTLGMSGAVTWIATHGDPPPLQSPEK